MGWWWTLCHGGVSGGPTLSCAIEMLVSDNYLICLLGRPGSCSARASVNNEAGRHQIVEFPRHAAVSVLRTRSATSNPRHPTSCHVQLVSSSHWTNGETLKILFSFLCWCSTCSGVGTLQKSELNNWSFFGIYGNDNKEVNIQLWKVLRLFGNKL